MSPRRRRRARTMPLGEIVRIYRGRLRERGVVVQELLAVLGIAVGVALLFASQVAGTSLDSSARQLARQVVGSTQWELLARGPEGFDGALAADAQRLPGVSAGMPVVEAHVRILGPRGAAEVALFGADPRFANVGAQLRRRFSPQLLARQRAIALPAPLASEIGANPLETVRVQVGGAVRESLLGTTLARSDIGGLVDGELAFAPLPYAQQLLGMPGRLSRLFLRVRPGHEREARARLSAFAAHAHLNLVPADFDVRLLAVADAPERKSEGLFSALSAIVGFLFAFNAMLLTVPARRSLIETMRRRGTTRLMVVQMLLFDAAVIGALGCLGGLALGRLLSQHVFGPEPGYLGYTFPVGTGRVVSASTVLLAVGAGMGSALLGVLAPVRSIVRRPLRNPPEHERSARRPARVAVGIACLALAAVILAVAPEQAVSGSLLLVLALLALLPLLFDGVLWLLARARRALASPALTLALTELDDPQTRVRSLAIAASAAIAVFGSVAILGGQRNLQSGMNITARGWPHIAQLWVSVSGQNNTLGVIPFPAGEARRLQALAGVASVGVYRGSFLDIGEHRLWVLAPPRSTREIIPAGELVSGDPATVRERLRSGGWAVLSDAVAGELRLHVGQAFTLPSPVPMRFRLAGLSTNMGWPPGALVLNASDYARAWGSSAASALTVALKQGVAPARARAEVQRALGGGSAFAVQTAGEREGAWSRASREGLARLSEIGTLMLITVVLAIAGAISSMIWQRRRRIAYIKQQGFARGVLWRALLAESAILLGAGCAIGAAFGSFGQILISDALRQVTGFPISISFTPLLALSSGGLITLAALAIVAVPGYRVVSVRAASSWV